MFDPRLAALATRVDCAADRADDLKAELTRLRAALAVFADLNNWRFVLGDPVWYTENTQHPVEFARKALEGPGDAKPS